MTDLEKKYIKQAQVNANWLEGGDSFWYRREAASGEIRFIIVDAKAKERREAFNHEAVAASLKKETGEDVETAKLPFERIELAPDASWARFKFKEKVWQYDDAGLKEWDGKFEEDEEGPAVPVAKSPVSGDSVTVAFLNHSGVTLTTEWLDYQGEWVRYFDLKPGKVTRQSTRVGHVWRVLERETKKVRKVYTASRSETTCIVETTMRKGSEVKEEKDQSGSNGHATPDPPKNEKKMPEVFIRKHNVWIRHDDKKEEALTFNGSEHAYYNKESIFVTEDRCFAVVYHVVPGGDVPLRLLEYVPKHQSRPVVHDDQQYPRPGDRIKQQRPCLFDLKRKTEIPISDALFRNPVELSTLHLAGWNESQSEFRVVYHERGHQCIRVLGINRQGDVRVILEETSETFIEQAKTYYHVFDETDEMLWASERDGYNHLYLYDLTSGKMTAQVTSGEWNVNAVEHIDAEARVLLIRGYGLVPEQDPYYAHLVRVHIPQISRSKSPPSPVPGKQILTDGAGTHHWSWSPGRRFLIDTWSRVDAPPTTVLRCGDSGAHILDLETTQASSLLDEGWNAPERFVAPGRDGKTLIYGVILRPKSGAESDAKAKHPVLEYIYAGPNDFHVPKSFGAVSKHDSHAFADEGYVVVKIDGMGTNWRNHAFHAVCWRDLADAGLPDRIAWMRAAGKERPWMDLDRVAIRGGSAGGANAVAAVLHHGDFYKVAIADSGCHDNRLDKRWWGEQWLGWPVGKQYEDSSNATHVGKLKEGKGRGLMLIVGDMDKNVDPACTMGLIKALNESEKRYEFLLMPGGGHCPGGVEIGIKRQKEFLKRHLLEA